MATDNTKLETIPPRFRVWDSKNNETYSGCNIEEAAKLLRYIGKKNAITSQDTGLKDKNGKNIYTGDIVRFPHDDTDTNAQVIYDHGASYVYKPGLYDCTPYLLLQVCHYEAEVIGNIWQNPELLENRDD